MHFYNKAGNPRYDANLRIARKEGLLPSVTTIDKIIASPGLEKYKLKQIFKASLNVPRNGLSEEEYYRLVEESANKHSHQTAKLGNVIHKLIERYLAGRILFFRGKRKDIWEIFALVRNWIDEQIEKIYQTEYIIVGADYAGKADCLVKLCNEEIPYLIDWKTTDPEGKIKKDGSPKKGKLFYAHHIRQLAALANAFSPEYPPGIMNVVISTNLRYKGIWIHKWNPEEYRKGLKEFQDAKNLWFSTNNYEIL